MEKTVHLRGVAAHCSQTLFDSSNWASVGGGFVLCLIMLNIFLVSYLFFYFATLIYSIPQRKKTRKNAFSFVSTNGRVCILNDGRRHEG